MKYDFLPYRKRIFIETGSAGGDGIAAAMKAGFQFVYSIELNPLMYTRCRERFKFRRHRVHLFCGDSRMVLPKILREIKEPVTFWLDAHWCGKGSAGEPDNTPLMEELETIAAHKIKTHTIIIDDLRLIRDKEEWTKFPYTIEDVLKYILSINPEYKISFDFGEDCEDILIATT